jgi:hypothetical protein
MEKQWSASFGRVREKGVRVKTRIITPVIALALWTGLVISARAEDPLVESPAALPQFETEQILDSQKGTQQVQPPKVGDQLVFKVKGVHSPGVQAFSDDKQASLEDQGWAISENQPSSSNEEAALTLVAVPLKAGKVVFPSLALQDVNGKVIGRTAPVAVEIASAISPTDPKPDQPEEAQPPAGLQFPFWIIILFGIVVTALVVLLGYSLYRGLKERARLRKKPEKILSEDEVALSELLKLGEQGLLEKGDFKRHYFRVSEILKNYVGKRYQFDAPESTTGEMIESLRKQSSTPVLVSEAVIMSLSLLFEHLDEVKFTDHVPESGESSQILGKAKEFIVNTRRSPLILNSSGVDKNADK